ncbi:hypothetical protein B1143_01450 [Enterococcus faecium]|nr:hypothetical protein B1143_01450 [Enterococcus faecium]
MVHSDSDLILHNSSVLIDKEPENYVYVFLFSSIFLLNFIFVLFTFRNKFTVTLDTFFYILLMYFLHCYENRINIFIISI